MIESKTDNLDFTEYTRAIKRGDRLVFREFVEMSFDRVFGLAFKMTADKYISEDIVQETFIKVWEKRSLIREDGSLSSWTLRIATNLCLDYLRKQKRNKQSSSSEYTRDLISAADSDKELRDEEAAALLNKLTAMLSPRQRMVFTLAVIDELSADEISVISGLSKERIKSNLYHARQEVRKNWEKLYADE